MIQPEDLRSATDKALYGLTADESLKQRILLKASQTNRTTRDSKVHPVMKLCAVVGVLLLMVVALNSVRPLSPSTPGEMNVFAAGGKDTTAEQPFSQIDVNYVSCISVGGIDYQDEAHCSPKQRKPMLKYQPAANILSSGWKTVKNIHSASANHMFSMMTNAGHATDYLHCCRTQENNK